MVELIISMTAAIFFCLMIIVVTDVLLAIIRLIFEAVEWTR